MSESSNSKWIMVGAVIGLLIGGLAGFLISPSLDISGYQEQIEQLETQVTTFQDRAQELEEELENSVSVEEYSDFEQHASSLITQLQSELARVRTEFNEHQKYPRGVINITALVEKWMTPQAEQVWEQKFEHFDIQLLIVVNVASQWADDLSEEFVTEFERQGGKAVSAGRYASELVGSNAWYVEMFLRGDSGPKDKAMIEYYGLNHTGILFIGGVEVCKFYQDRGPLTSELPLIAIGRDNKVQYLDPRWQ